MSTGLAVIQRVIVAVAEGKNEQVQVGLQALPLHEVSDETAESLLTWLLEQAYKVKNVEVVRIIMTIFNIKRASVDQLPALAKLLLNTSLSRDALTFVIGAFPERSPMTYYGELFNSQNDINALKAGALLSVLFPDITNEEWSYLRATIGDYEDEDEHYEFHLPLLKAFIESKVADTGAAVSRPEWIVDCAIQAISEVPSSYPSVKTAVSLLIDDMRTKHLINDDAANDDEFQNNFISQYSISTMTEKHGLLSTVLPQLPLYNDAAVFQELGPVNSTYTHKQILDCHHKCHRYGGCRMLTCTEYESISIEGNNVDIMDQHDFIADWFRESCDKCSRRIAKRCYAIREPLLHGGWRGCYCSLECLTSMPMNNHQAMMVGRIKEQLSVIGIRDRK